MLHTNTAVSLTVECPCPCGGEVEIYAQGDYTPGHGGRFNPRDGGEAPEPADFDLRGGVVTLPDGSTWDLLPWLDTLEDRGEAIAEKIRERAIEESD